MYFTPATVAVGLALYREPDAEHWGYALAKTLDLACPTVNTVLRRMHDAGWLAVRAESRHNAPARRLYRLTDAGRDGLERLRQAAGKPPPTAGPRRRARPRGPAPARPTGTCPECRTDHVLRDDGWLPGHRRAGRPCAGSWEEPLAQHGILADR
ncbi:MAG TPA: PadR family transcriptional regulator [Actinophytocola sp.]|jgi:DNA-binding MarR family transcriptional regulator|nr:PadR family transcriptional regulator [Actinophytocola sp.]